MRAQSMVFYMDGVIGEMVAAIQAKEGMWDNTIWVHQSDNGGPSFTGSSHTANNCEGPSLPSPHFVSVSIDLTKSGGRVSDPQKGSKMSNWQVREPAYLIFKNPPAELIIGFASGRHPCQRIRLWRPDQVESAGHGRHQARRFHPRRRLVRGLYLCSHCRVADRCLLGWQVRDVLLARSV